VPSRHRSEGYRFSMLWCSGPPPSLVVSDRLQIVIEARYPGGEPMRHRPCFRRNPVKQVSSSDPAVRTRRNRQTVNMRSSWMPETSEPAAQAIGEVARERGSTPAARLPLVPRLLADAPDRRICGSAERWLWSGDGKKGGAVAGEVIFVRACLEIPCGIGEEGRIRRSQ
jgi:hypothetical protein